jgi:hypothetical protein
MRARIRHFSYKAAGSSITLDSRYVRGISNNTRFSPWEDISGNANNATQISDGNRGTYYATETNLGGQPTVWFSTPTQMGWTAVTSKSSFLVMYRPSGNYYNFGVGLDNGVTGASNAGVHCDVNADYTYQWTPGVQRVNRASVTDNSGKWWSSGGVGYFEDSSGKAMKSLGYSTGGSFGPNAYISHVSLFTTVLDSSLVRRIENHLGFSFKLKN